MRIPISNIYRAFPELDDYDDEQCARLMRRIQLNLSGHARRNTISLSVCAASLLLTLATSKIIYDFFAKNYDFVSKNDLIFLPCLLFILGVSAAALVLTRDIVLRRQLKNAIDYELDRVRCLNCRYILIAQQPKAGMLTCPECGTQVSLARLGITEDDLIPPPAAVSK